MAQPTFVVRDPHHTRWGNGLAGFSVARFARSLVILRTAFFIVVVFIAFVFCKRSTAATEPT